MSVDGKVAVEPQGKLKKKYVSPSGVSKLRRPPLSRSERVCIFARRRDLGEHDVVVSGGRVVGKGGNVLKVARISKAAPLRRWKTAGRLPRAICKFDSLSIFESRQS